MKCVVIFGRGFIHIIVFVDLHELVVDNQQVAGKFLGNSAPFPDLYSRGLWKAIKEPFDWYKGSIVKGELEEYSRARAGLQLKENQSNDREMK